MSLSDGQIRAAHRLGQDVCVVAGPGSGKTSVLIERFRWLVESQRVPASRILGITFTEKGALEIKHRLVREFRAAPERRREIERAWLSTIHGFCARLLREHALEAGVDPEFEVLEATRSAQWLRESAEEALDGVLAKQPALAMGLLDSLCVSNDPGERSSDLADTLIEIHEALRVAGGVAGSSPDPEPEPDPSAELAAKIDSVLSEKLPLLTAAQAEAHRNFRRWLEAWQELAGLPPGPAHFEWAAGFQLNRSRLKPGTAARSLAGDVKEEWLDRLRGAWMDHFRGPLRQLLAGVLERLGESYRGRKRLAGTLDFCDLEEAAISLLARGERVRVRVRDSFDYILMDEFQDTNPLQWRLLELIRRPGRFFAVGDINQSIYGFRHAQPEIFARYRAGLREAGESIDELMENHRSRPEILAAVEATLGAAEGIEVNRLLASRPCLPGAEASVELIAGCGDDREAATGAEAAWVARRIGEIEGSLEIEQEGHRRPARFGDIAVLARSVNAFGPLAAALDRYQVPFLVSGGRTFYEAREIRDLTGLLAALANPLDEIRLAGVLRSPLVGVTDETLLRLKIEGGLAEALDRLTAGQPMSIAEADADALRGFWRLAVELRSIRDAVSPDRLLIPLLDQSGYELILGERPRANIAKFLGLLRGWHSREPKTLPALIEEIARRRSQETEPEAPPADPHAVRLMTIHQAKGLQFPIVFVYALHRGVDQRRPALRWTPEAGLGGRWRDPATSKPCADTACQAADRMETLGERREENRLLYVAMTRAQEHLALSFAKTNRGSSWTRLMTAGFGLDLEAVQPESFSQQLPDGTRVTVTISWRAPEATAAARASAPPRDLRLVDPPAARGQHDSTAPVTHIAAFLACPRQYYLEHYLGWGALNPPARPEEEAPEENKHPDGRELGIEVHRLLAGEAPEVADAEAIRLAGVFRSSTLAARSSRASRVEREFDFLAEVEDIVLRGQIDLWYEEGGERLLVDYKTDAFDPEAEPARLDPYLLQVRLYALGLASLDGRLPDRAFLYFLRHARAVPVSLEGESLNSAREQVRAFRDAQDRVEFPLRPGERCLRCAFYRGMCPAGTGEEVSSRPARFSLPAHP